MLVMQPGRLTTLHLHGVRARFVSPFGLYVAAGAMFLAILRFLTDGPRVQLDLVDFNIIIRRRVAACTPSAPATCGWTDHVAAAGGARWGDEPASTDLVRRLLHDMPWVAFLALPIFAIVVARLHQDRAVRFGGHLVFAAHLQGFWFLLATLTLFLHGGLAVVAALVAPGYALCSLHEVYGGRWYCTTLRAIGIAIVYLAVLLAMSAVAMAVSSAR